MPNVFSSRLSCTPEEATTTVSTSEMSFVQNIFEGEMMEIFSKVTHNIYQIASLFSLIVGGKGYALAPGNPSKERDIWKGK